MPCHNFKRLYKSSLAKILGQYCENVDIAILTRYSLEYRANIGRTIFRQYCIVNNGQFWLKNIAQILVYQYWCSIGFTKKINKIYLRQMNFVYCLYEETLYNRFFITWFFWFYFEKYWYQYYKDYCTNV